MLWPRRVWWCSGERAASGLHGRCAGCAVELASTAEFADATGPANTAASANKPSANTAQSANTPSANKPSANTAASAARPVTEAEPAAPDAFAYCSTCRRDRERHREAVVLAMALALLGAAGTALALPLVRPNVGLFAHVFSTLFAAALPIAGLGSLPRRVGLWGSTARAWPEGRWGVVLESRESAAELTRDGVACRPLRLPPIVYRRSAGLVLAAALGVAGVGYAWHHPRLWVLDVGAVPLTLWVDGVAQCRLAPSRAGAAHVLLLRLPSGARHLEARDDGGRVVAEARAALQPGREHLFAPGGADECFWLERTGYGRDRTHEARPLSSASRFFTLDADVDGWVSGSAPPAANDRRSTGGTLTLLRHSPCPRAPEPVRAASAVGP